MPRESDPITQGARGKRVDELADHDERAMRIYRDALREGPSFPSFTKRVTRSSVSHRSGRNFTLQYLSVAH